MERVHSGATPHIPGAYEDFVRTVVPGLQKRGLLREDYDESKMPVGLVLKNLIGCAERKKALTGNTKYGQQAT